MAEPAERQRTVFRIPRVEFDLSAMALGAIGWLAYVASWSLLAGILGFPDGLALRDRFFTAALRWVGLAAAPGPFGDLAHLGAGDLPKWKFAVVTVWMLVLWSLVAGAIARVYAIRIARDESIGVMDALGFAFSNLKQFVFAPVFVAAAAVFFFGLASLAGVVSAIPGVGPFAQVLAHPLALLAGLGVVVIGAGGLFGLPMMQAALATERNGTLDAISRTFSYVYTRPVVYLLSAGVVAFVCRVIDAFGGAFLDMTTRALTFGAGWNSDASSMIGSGSGAGRDDTSLFGWPQPLHGEGVAVVGFYVAWFMTALAAVAIHGYLFAYFVGGLTDIYFMLRRDVDGIDEGEVYAEGAEPSLGSPLAGEPAGGTKS